MSLNTVVDGVGDSTLREAGSMGVVNFKCVDGYISLKRYVGGAICWVDNIDMFTIKSHGVNSLEFITKEQLRSLAETVGSTELLNVMGVLRSIDYYGIINYPIIMLIIFYLKTNTMIENKETVENKIASLLRRINSFRDVKMRLSTV